MFIRKLTQSNHIGKISRILELEGWIKINHSYRVGKYCKTYCLSPQLMEARWEREDFVDFIKFESGRAVSNYWEKFQKQLTDWRELPEDHPCYTLGEFTQLHLEKVSCEYTNETESDVLSAARQSQEENEVAVKEENKEIDRRNRYRASRGWSQIEHKTVFTTTESIAQTYRDSILAFATPDEKYVKFHLDRKDSLGTGRLFTNITNLKSEFRKHLRYEGKELVNCDIRCAQVCLLSLFFRDTPEHCEEKAKFIDFVLRTDFYSELAARSEGVKLSRQEAKQQSFVLMFARNQTSWRQPFYKVFKELFPLLAAEISQIKESDYKRVAFEMQSGESKIMIEGVLGDLMKQDIPGFSIHDSILCLPEDLEKIKETIILNFEKVTGFKPILKCG